MTHRRREHLLLAVVLRAHVAEFGFLLRALFTFLLLGWGLFTLTPLALLSLTVLGSLRVVLAQDDDLVGWDLVHRLLLGLRHFKFYWILIIKKIGVGVCASAYQLL